MESDKKLHSFNIGKHSYLKTCATVRAFGSPESSGSGDGNNSSNNDGGSNPDFSKISLVLVSCHCYPILMLLTYYNVEFFQLNSVEQCCLPNESQ